MRRPRSPLLGWPVALIVTLVTGCDNVDWGGADIAIVPPPPQASGEAEAVAPTEERVPEGPVLYYVRADQGRGTMVPIGEIAGDSLRPIRAEADWERYGQRFIAAHLRPGSEFTLFRRGARVGTFILESSAIPGVDVCPRAPYATGVLELTAGAEDIPEFLAIPKASARSDLPLGVRVELVPDRRMQLLGPILAERLLRARGAPLPGNWTRAMAQLQPFPIAGAEAPAFSATFLVGDSLGIGGDDEGYSLFFIAHPVPQVGYDTAYAAFNPYEQTGKAAPRLADFLDWDRDGRTELLLEVYGTAGSWFEALAPIDGGWRTVLSTQCR